MYKVKLVFYPYKQKIRKKTSHVPIYLRIRKGPDKVEVCLDLSIHADELQFWDALTERLVVKDNDVNKRLEDILDDFKGLPYRFKSEYPKMSPADIKEKLFPQEKSNNAEVILVLNYMEDHFEKVIKPNMNISDGTKRNYRKSINHLTGYLSFMKQSKVSLANFSPALAFGFYDYLQKEIISIKKRSITDVSASSVTIKIKAIFGRALDTDLINKNPFKKVKLQTKSPKRAELTIDEINSLLRVDLSQNPKLDIYRDLFLFSVFTGMAYGDVYNLKKNDIVEENGEYTISKNRQKTDEPIGQVLVEQAVNIIRKYDNHIETLPEGRLFPRRHLNNVNESLKLL